MYSSKTVSGITLPLSSQLLSLPILYKFARLFNKLFSAIYLIAISRYSSTLSIYSARDDQRLYSQPFSGDNFRFLNLGSGFFSHPKWSCIDLPAKSSIYKAVQGKIYRDFLPADLNIDSLKSLFEPDTFHAIYSSHTIEHLSRPVLHSLFVDIYYVLRENGVFRICIPDLQSFYNVLKHLPSPANDEILFFLKESYTPLHSYLSTLPICESSGFLLKIMSFIRSASLHETLDYVTNLYHSLNLSGEFPPDFHISYPTASFLMKLASKVGFSYGYVTCKAMSYSPVFKNKYLFDTTIPDMSLYMEFIK